MQNFYSERWAVVVTPRRMPSRTLRDCPDTCGTYMSLPGSSQSIDQKRQALEHLKLRLERERVEEELLEIETRREKKRRKRDGPILHLNVGGRVFTTTKSTVTAYNGSMLASMFSSDYVPGATDDDDNWFIDRNPDLFEHILEFLRTQRVPKNFPGLIAEAEFFGLSDLAQMLRQQPEVDMEQKEYACISFKEYNRDNRAVVHFYRVTLDSIDHEKTKKMLTSTLDKQLGAVSHQFRECLMPSFRKVTSEGWNLFNVAVDTTPRGRCEDRTLPLPLLCPLP